MPQYSDPYVADNGLNGAKNTVTAFRILSGYPSSYASIAALTLYSLNAPTLTGPATNADGDWRQLTLAAAAVTGTYSASGRATHVVLEDSAASRRLIVQEIAVPWDCVEGQAARLDADLIFAQPMFTGA